MAEVNLRKITSDNDEECLRLEVQESQKGFVASNAKSLDFAKKNTTMFPLAIYDATARGYATEEVPVPMVGFTMYHLLEDHVGFILRLMVDKAHQRKGYGRAAMVEVIRRLKLYPEVEMIATSYRRVNEAAGNLYRGLGFVPWEIEWARVDKSEVYLKLPEWRW